MISTHLIYFELACVGFVLTSWRTVPISALWPLVFNFVFLASEEIDSSMEKKRQPNNTFTPIGQVLDSILDQCRSETAGGILNLVHVWEKAVGPPISDNAKPFAVKGSLLLVHVSSSAWLHQLRFLKIELLEKLNHSLKNERIEDIKFKIGLI